MRPDSAQTGFDAHAADPPITVDFKASSPVLVFVFVLDAGDEEDGG
jgi:hypothetical protein